MSLLRARVAPAPASHSPARPRRAAHHDAHDAHGLCAAGIRACSVTRGCGVVVVVVVVVVVATLLGAGIALTYFGVQSAATTSAARRAGHALARTPQQQALVDRVVGGAAGRGGGQRAVGGSRHRWMSHAKMEVERARAWPADLNDAPASCDDGTTPATHGSVFSVLPTAPPTPSERRDATLVLAPELTPTRPSAAGQPPTRGRLRGGDRAHQTLASLSASATSVAAAVHRHAEASGCSWDSGHNRSTPRLHFVPPTTIPWVHDQWYEVTRPGRLLAAVRLSGRKQLGTTVKWLLHFEGGYQGVLKVGTATVVRSWVPPRPPGNHSGPTRSAEAVRLDAAVANCTQRWIDSDRGASASATRPVCWVAHTSDIAEMAGHALSRLAGHDRRLVPRLLYFIHPSWLRGVPGLPDMPFMVGGTLSPLVHGLDAQLLPPDECDERGVRARAERGSLPAWSDAVVGTQLRTLDFLLNNFDRDGVNWATVPFIPGLSAAPTGYGRSGRPLRSPQSPPVGRLDASAASGTPHGAAWPVLLDFNTGLQPDDNKAAVRAASAFWGHCCRFSQRLVSVLRSVTAHSVAGRQLRRPCSALSRMLRAMLVPQAPQTPTASSTEQAAQAAADGGRAHRSAAKPLVSHAGVAHAARAEPGPPAWEPSNDEFVEVDVRLAVASRCTGVADAVGEGPKPGSALPPGVDDVVLVSEPGLLEQAWRLLDFRAALVLDEVVGCGFGSPRAAHVAGRGR